MKKTKKRKTFEIKFFEKLIKTKPSFVEALTCLGDAYTKGGFYQEGLEVDLRLSKLLPDDPVVHYNLACSYSLLGKIDEALSILKRAILLGYDDFAYLTKDKDLENVRKDARFGKLMRKIHRGLPQRTRI